MRLFLTIEPAAGEATMREVIAAREHLRVVLAARGIALAAPKVVNRSDTELVDAMMRVREANWNHEVWVKTTPATISFSAAADADVTPRAYRGCHEPEK